MAKSQLRSNREKKKPKGDKNKKASRKPSAFASTRNERLPQAHGPMKT
jgi:hypothetical protein